MRSLGVGDTVEVYFTVVMTDGEPALNEAGNLPQVLINSGSWSSNGFSVLVHLGYGRYSATLNTSLISITTGDTLQTRYKGPATKESQGESFYIGTQVPDNISITYYGTLQEANLYFSKKLNTRPWDAASDGDKIKALTEATHLIDRLNFSGTIANTGQVLQFPRKNTISISGTVTTTSDINVPEDIKLATYHIAIMLLDGYDSEIEAEKLMTEMNKYQSVQSYYDRSFIPEYRTAGIPSVVAWGYLKPYLRDSREILLTRVS